MSLHKRTKRRPTYNEYGIKNGVVIEIERVVDGLSATRKLSRTAFWEVSLFGLVVGDKSCDYTHYLRVLEPPRTYHSDGVKNVPVI